MHSGRRDTCSGSCPGHPLGLARALAIGQSWQRAQCVDRLAGEPAGSGLATKTDIHVDATSTADAVSPATGKWRCPVVAADGLLGRDQKKAPRRAGQVLGDLNIACHYR